MQPFSFHLSQYESKINYSPHATESQVSLLPSVQGEWGSLLSPWSLILSLKEAWNHPLALLPEKEAVWLYLRDIILQTIVIF